MHTHIQPHTTHTYTLHTHYIHTHAQSNAHTYTAPHIHPFLALVNDIGIKFVFVLVFFSSLSP